MGADLREEKMEKVNCKDCHYFGVISGWGSCGYSEDYYCNFSEADRSCEKNKKGKCNSFRRAGFFRKIWNNIG